MAASVHALAKKLGQLQNLSQATSTKNPPLRQAVDVSGNHGHLA